MLRRTILAAALVMLPAASLACGAESDCLIGERHYRIALPGADTPPTGAIVYLHGYRGSARGAMRNKALIAFAHDRGMALVAAKSAGNDWDIPGVPSNPSSNGQAELAYFDALIEDLNTRFGIDTSRLLVTGFSAGGMMVWTLACHRGQSFAAFVPVSGTFWAPVPERCPSAPVTLIHVHGTSDPVVPLAGRRIASTRQGNVLDALDRARRTGGFAAAETSVHGDLSCSQDTNADGNLLAFCTHPGGHSFRIADLEAAWTLLAPRAGL